MVRVPGYRTEMYCVSCEVRTESIYVEESRSPLWSSGQSSWLYIQRSGFYSLRYQIFWEVVGLERGPLSLVSTIEELLETKSSGFGLESRDYGRRDPSRWPRGILYPQKLTLTSSTSGCRSIGIVRSRTKTTDHSIQALNPQRNWWHSVSPGLASRRIATPGLGLARPVSAPKSPATRLLQWGTSRCLHLHLDIPLRHQQATPTASLR
jgi:hypothetical protein